MMLDEVNRPDAEILITRGQNGDRNEPRTLVGYVPFQFEGQMGHIEYNEIIKVFQALETAYECWPDQYINMEIRINREYINI